MKRKLIVHIARSIRKADMASAEIPDYEVLAKAAIKKLRKILKKEMK